MTMRAGPGVRLVCALAALMACSNAAIGQESRILKEDGANMPLLPVPEARSEPSASAAQPRPSASASAFAAYQLGNYILAKSLAEPIAKLGDPHAQALLGEIYLDGLGVPRDVDEAARWFEAAAKSGDKAAQFEFAMLLLAGTGVARDETRALELLKAAADAKIPLAEFNYAQLLLQISPTSGFESALPYFRSAADAGIADAQYAMAQLLATGRGTDKDEVKARNWLQRAAVNGFGIAQIEYGIWLLNGRGGETRSEEGFRFLRLAALAGNPIAINRVAHLYKDGLGTKPDTAEAAKWAVLAKRMDNSDPVLDGFFEGLGDAAQRTALEAANRFRPG